MAHVTSCSICGPCNAGCEEPGLCFLADRLLSEDYCHIDGIGSCLCAEPVRQYTEPGNHLKGNKLTPNGNIQIRPILSSSKQKGCACSQPFHPVIPGSLHH